MTSRAFSLYMRRSHMYVALFLTPWILLYAISALVFNHLGTIRSLYHGGINQFEQVDEMEYKGAFGVDITPAAAAKQILLDLNMDGAHRIQGKLNGERFTIIRDRPYAQRRVIYFPKQGRVVVEKQVANLPSMLIRLHLKHGLAHDYTLMNLWGLGVELTALFMIFLILSGLWMWWGIKPARRWGAAFGLGGLGLFAVLLFTL